MIFRNMKNEITFRELCQIVDMLPDERAPENYRSNIICSDAIIHDYEMGVDKRGYNIQVKNLFIVIDNLGTDDGERLVASDHIIDLSNDACNVVFQKNTFIEKRKGRRIFPRICSGSIEFVNNTLHNASLALEAETIRLKGNTETQEGCIAVGNPTDEKNEPTETPLECIVSNNTLNYLWVAGKGRLDLLARNTIRRWNIAMDKEECQKFEWFIGPNLNIAYPVRELLYLQQVRRGFMVLLKKSIKREDMLQQRIIRNEISRLDYHIFKENAETVRDLFDLFPRWLVYTFKLQFLDRILFLKFMLWAVVVATAMTSPVGPFKVIPEWGMWKWELWGYIAEFVIPYFNLILGWGVWDTGPTGLDFCPKGIENHRYC